MSKTSPNEGIVIWGAVGPNGEVVKSSVGTFRAVAHRWAQRHKDYVVMRLGEVKVGDGGPYRWSAPTQRPTLKAVADAVRRGPGRPRKYPIIEGGKE